MAERPYTPPGRRGGLGHATALCEPGGVSPNSSRRRISSCRDAGGGGNIDSSSSSRERAACDATDAHAPYSYHGERHDGQQPRAHRLLGPHDRALCIARPGRPPRRPCAVPRSPQQPFSDSISHRSRAECSDALATETSRDGGSFASPNPSEPRSGGGCHVCGRGPFDTSRASAVVIAIEFQRIIATVNEPAFASTGEPVPRLPPDPVACCGPGIFFPARGLAASPQPAAEPGLVQPRGHGSPRR